MDNNQEKKNGFGDIFKKPDTLRNEGAKAEKREIVKGLLDPLNKAIDRICEMEEERDNLSEPEKKELDAHYALVGSIRTACRLVIGGTENGKFRRTTIISRSRDFTPDNTMNLSPESGDLEAGDLAEIVKFPIFDLTAYEVPESYQRAQVKIVRKADQQ